MVLEVHSFVHRLYFLFMYLLLYLLQQQLMINMILIIFCIISNSSTEFWNSFNTLFNNGCNIFCTWSNSKSVFGAFFKVVTPPWLVLFKKGNSSCISKKLTDCDSINHCFTLLIWSIHLVYWTKTWVLRQILYLSAINHQNIKNKLLNQNKKVDIYYILQQ